MVLGKGYVCDVPDRLAGRADARGEIGEGSGVEASEAGGDDVDGYLLLFRNVVDSSNNGNNSSTRLQRKGDVFQKCMKHNGRAFARRNAKR